jgi:RNA polymerase sigma-70 factor (ECF subfamily)
LGSAALAEEAAQSAFSRLAAKSSSVARHPERLRAWLCRTAYLEACKLARREYRLSCLPLPPEPDPAPMNRPEIYDQLDAALNRLPELDRELVIRHCCDGEEYRDIAAAVGKSAAACQKRVERALAVLGRNLGGAKTAGVALAGIAASSAKCPALPSAERIAAVALQHQAATGAAVGTLSGLKAAACAGLVLAGSVAGWERREAPPPPPESVRSAARTAADTRSASSTPQVPVLAPRPLPRVRTRTDVLETIQAGRLGPLVEFLPQATVADLQAIIAEDDIYQYGETDGKDHFGTARNLALLQWAEKDPAGAFQHAKARDYDAQGFWLGDTAAVLSRWLKSDPAAAAKAISAIPLIDRAELAREFIRSHSALADDLAAACPNLAWMVAEQRDNPNALPNRVLTLEDAERVLATVLNGPHLATPTPNEQQQLAVAFGLLAKHDPDAAIARAESIPWPEVRAQVLVPLYQVKPPESGRLAPGPLRAFALQGEAHRLMASNPEAAIRKFQTAPPGAERDAYYQAVASGLAGSDPWRLLDLVAATRDGAVTWADGPLKQALEFAGRTDPHRALALLPGLAARVDGRFSGFQGLAETVVTAWLERDPAAAIRFAATTGVGFSHAAMENTGNDPQPLVALLSDENDQIRRHAMDALGPHLATALAAGTAQRLVAGMPRNHADDLIERAACEASEAGFDEVMRIAALASPEVRREKILPEIAFRLFEPADPDLPTQPDDPNGTVAWVKSLPAADQQAILAELERRAASPDYASWNLVKIRKLIARLQP